MELLEICDVIQSRRRFYLLDDRFSSVIAFLAGASLAAPDDPLKGFQEWVSEKTLQKNSPIQWAYINQIPPEIQELLVEDTVELVREFLTLKENKKE